MRKDVLEKMCGTIFTYIYTVHCLEEGEQEQEQLLFKVTRW